MDTLASYNMYSLPGIEATLDEEDSHFLLSRYLLERKFNFVYSYPGLDFDQVVELAQKFCFFAAKIQDAATGKMYPFNVPLNVFRFMLLEDGSWSKYYTVHRQSGYVVEGMHWSNGLVYQVRDDNDHPTVHQMVLSIDNITKFMHGFPDHDEDN